MSGTFTLKGLSKWSIEGLDLTDAAFSKLHSKESKLDIEKKKYEELEPEKNNNGQGKSNVENNQSGTKRKKQYETPKWKLVAPKDGEPKLMARSFGGVQNVAKEKVSG